jgi:acetylornithine/N-succinyldiaminopimelate aminotransferase
MARDRGLLLNAPKPHCLRFMPALNTTPAEVKCGLELLRQIFSEIENEEQETGHA